MADGDAKTRAGDYCRHLIEAACLVALLVVPLFFNMFSARVFDPDKVAILRSVVLFIAAVALVGAVLRLLKQPSVSLPVGQWIRDAVRIPLVLPVAIYMLVFFISTACAISTKTSFWGSYLRLQGTFTMVSYIAVGVALLYVIRTRSQVERVVATIIVAGIPVSVYGIVQSLGGTDGMWSVDASERIISTIGNPIFVGAFLIMVLPFTVRAVILSVKGILDDRNHGWVNPVLFFCYSSIAILQVVALYLTRSRGPLLGGMVGLTLFGALYFLRWKKRWVALGITLVPVMLAGVFIAYQMRPAASSKGKHSGDSRYRRLLDVKERNSRVRIVIWQGVARLMTRNPQIGYSDEFRDGLNPLRPLVGFGPDSLMTVFSRVYPPELGRYEDRRTRMADRAHNETWNTLVETGLLGVCAYLALFVSFFYHGFRRLGMVRDRRRSIIFLSCCAGGAVVTSAAFLLLQGVVFLGPAIPIGIAGGIFLYLWIIALSDGDEACAFGGDNVMFGLLVAVMSAVMGHFAEMQVGIPTTVTRLYFWVLAALFILLSWREPAPEADQGAAAPANAARTIIADAGFAGVLVAVLLSTVAYDLVLNIKSSTSSLAILDSAMGSYPGFVFILSCLLASVVLVLSSPWRGPWLVALLSIGAVILISGILAVGFSCLHAMEQAMLARKIAGDVRSLVAREFRVETLLTVYYAFMFALILLAGFFMAGRRHGCGLRGSGPALACAAAAVCISAPLIYETNLRGMHADICVKSAHAYFEKKNYPAASALYLRAIRLDPSEERGYLSFAEDLHAWARTADKTMQRERILDQAVHLVKVAQGLSPFRYESVADLGLLYAWWATVTEGDEIMKTRARIADSYYEQALMLSPNNVNFWTERALLNMRSLNNIGKGEKYLRRALELDPKYSWPHKVAGDYFMFQAGSRSSRAEREAELEKALAQYESAIKHIEWRDPVSEAECHAIVSRLYSELGDRDRALSSARAAVRAAKARERPMYRKALQSLEERLKSDPGAQ